MKLFRTVVLMLLLVVVGVLAAQWLTQESGRDFGEVFVRFGGYDYSTTVPRAVAAALLAAMLLWLLWRLLSLPFRVWSQHRGKQARARLIEGLEALHGGYWQRAEKLLERAAADPEVDAVALAAAVRAADARDDTAAAQRHLDALTQRNPVAAVLLGAERALARQQYAAALALLDTPAAQPLPPRGVLLRVQALAASQRAGEAWGLLGSLRQQQVLASDALTALEAELAAQSLQQADDANVLAERGDTLPKPLRSDVAVVTAYAGRAAALRWDDAATRSLEHALDAQWDESLVRLYGQLAVGKLDSRRASAQRWLQAHPASPALLVTLARLARRQDQWGQAQEFLHRALAQGAGAEAWEEMGEGFAAAGDEAMAQRCFANALKTRRGEAAIELPGRDIRQKIYDQAVVEERDEHGVPRLRP